MTPSRETHRASRPGWPAVARHTFILTVEPKTAADLASCGDYHARSSRSSAAHDLARLMVTAGEPDGPIEARGHDGAVRYTVRSLHAFAKFAISENPRPQRVRWRPVDFGGSTDTSEGADPP